MEKIFIFYTTVPNLGILSLIKNIDIACAYISGYVQGMSDLLSPILMLMESEEDAFWCFVGLMEIEEQIFEETQELTKQNLHKLSKLIQFLYPRFAAFLGRIWKFLLKV